MQLGRQEVCDLSGEARVTCSMNGPLDENTDDGLHLWNSVWLRCEKLEVVKRQCGCVSRSGKSPQDKQKEACPCLEHLCSQLQHVVFGSQRVYG